MVSAVYEHYAGYRKQQHIADNLSRSAYRKATRHFLHLLFKCGNNGQTKDKRRYKQPYIIHKSGLEREVNKAVSV